MWTQNLILYSQQAPQEKVVFLPQILGCWGNKSEKHCVKGQTGQAAQEVNGVGTKFALQDPELGAPPSQPHLPGNRGSLS